MLLDLNMNLIHRSVVKPIPISSLVTSQSLSNIKFPTKPPGTDIGTLQLEHYCILLVVNFRKNVGVRGFR